MAVTELQHQPASAVDDSHAIEERLLVLLAQSGDSNAFGRLIDWYDGRLFYFVQRLLGDADGALDVLQSVWLTVHRQLPKLRSPETFRVWLYRIAHDQAVSELRRKSKRPFPMEEANAPEPPDTATSHDARFDDAELVHRALQDLSVDHRRVLTLRFLEDMSIEDIAEIVGSGSGTIKSRLHYARAALRQRIEELLHD